MIKFLPIILLSFNLSAQEICIPLSIGDSLESDVQRGYLYHKLADERGERIQVMTKIITLKDSINHFHIKIERLYDSVSVQKDSIIFDEKKEINILKRKGRLKVKIWWVPVGIFLGWIIGKT